MRLVIERGELLRALGHVASVVERRTTIPILSNVFLRASPNELQLKATDLEREVVETVTAVATQPGVITVPAQMLHDIVRKLPDGVQVDLKRDAERERVLLTAGQARFSLQALPGDDFPDIAAGVMSHAFDLAAADLRRLIEKTRFAISTEETRYYLNGIYLHVADRNGKPSLRAVATDGHRLAQLDLPAPAGCAGMPGVIIPRKTVHEIALLAEATEGPVRLEISPAKVRIVIGRITLTSKLVDGTFPDYGRVIPQSNDRLLEVSTTQFIGAIDRVSTIASERGKAVKLNAAAGKLVVSVTNPDGGSATEELPAEYNAPPMEIGFNARYLLELSQQLESDKLRFVMSDPGSPALIRDGDDLDSLYVIMPMRV